MPSRHLGFKVIFRVIKVRDVIFGEMDVYSRSEWAVLRTELPGSFSTKMSN